MNNTLPEQYVSRKFVELGYKAEYQKASGTWVCCCPVCMEGHSWGKKKRCFYIPKKDLIYCHNCGWSSRPLKWIREVSGMSYKDVLADLESDGFSTRMVNLDIVEETPEPPREQVEESDLPLDAINLFDEIQTSFYAKKSAVKRALAYISQRRLNTAVNKPTAFYTSLAHPTHRNRLIIPFYDAVGGIPFYQSRAIGGGVEELEKIRYLSKKNAPRTAFNLNKIDPSIKYLFVFEGPLDACFVRNGIAVAGINTSKSSDFTPEQRQQLSHFEGYKIIWCLDSQWLDEASKVKTGLLLKEGQCVFVWPKREGKLYKDFNALCIAEQKDEIPVEWVLSNSLCGEMSLIKYKATWIA